MANPDYDSKASRYAVIALWIAVIVGAWFVFDWPVALWTTGVILLWSRATGEILRSLRK